MAVPKRHKTSSTRDQRRMHIFVTAPALATCQKCSKPVKAHTICKSCGYYKGNEIINVLKKLTKKERKQKEKEIKDTEKEQKNKPMDMDSLSKR